jgi:hypothetical protein
MARVPAHKHSAVSSYIYLEGVNVYALSAFFTHMDFPLCRLSRLLMDMFPDKVDAV